MFGRRIFSAAIAVALSAAPAAAQSLGDVARQEEARRASAQKAVKTLSNADLDSSAIVASAGAAPAEPSCYMSKSKGQCVSAQEMVATSVAGSLTKETAPFEETFRRESKSIRTQIEKTQASIATLEAVVADEGRSVSDRKAAERTLVGVRQALVGFERQWEKLEKAAANQRIPRKWIEPIPTLTTAKP
jgi:hypothetical protein